MRIPALVMLAAALAGIGAFAAEERGTATKPAVPLVSRLLGLEGRGP